MTLNQHSNEFREQARSGSLPSARLQPRGPPLMVGRAAQSPASGPLLNPAPAAAASPPDDLRRGRAVGSWWIFMLVLRRGEEPGGGVWSTAEVDVMFRLRTKQRNQSRLIPSASRSPAPLRRPWARRASETFVNVRTFAEHDFDSRTG